MAYLSFLRPEDSMAGSDCNRHAFWPDVLVASEEMVRLWLRRFEIVSFNEHRKSGIAVNGAHHDWHIYSVVARKDFNESV